VEGIGNPDANPAITMLRPPNTVMPIAGNHAVTASPDALGVFMD
jgi:hypothetical protein